MLIATPKEFLHTVSRNTAQSGIDLSMPCISRQQQHRSNPEHSSTEDYLKTLVIPFLDHLIIDISSRFTAHAKQAAIIEHLLPINITSEATCANIKEVVELYSNDLPNTCILDVAGCVSGCRFH